MNTSHDNSDAFPRELKSNDLVRLMVALKLPDRITPNMDSHAFSEDLQALRALFFQEGKNTLRRFRNAELLNLLPKDVDDIPLTPKQIEERVRALSHFLQKYPGDPSQEEQ